MDRRSQELLTTLELAGFERIALNGEVRIAYRGVAILAYSSDDAVARDFVIATLLSDGLSGKSVAALCSMSAAHVTGVRQRVAAGGVQALAVRGRPGAPMKLTGRKLKRVRQMYDEGRSLNAIAGEIGVSWDTVRKTLKRLGLPTTRKERQPPLPTIGGAGARERMEPTESAEETERGTNASRPDENVFVETHEDVSAETHEDDASAETSADVSAEAHERAEADEELLPGEELTAGPAEHPTRYAGTLLIAAAMAKLGVPKALREANAVRQPKAVYDAEQMVVALACAWIAGHGSLESMHERDARGLGVVLGLERSPSVRTAHRAVAEMVACFDPLALGAGLIRGLRQATRDEPTLFGIDGHHKQYSGDAPIDKGWNSKRRMATRGLADVLVHDADGKTWMSLEVGVGDALSQHVLTAARRLRGALGAEQRIVLGFDRGGFSFDLLCAMDREGFGYIAWVPANARMPALETVAPAADGVGDIVWEHESLDHRCRLVVERDGDALLPATTNLPSEFDAAEVMRMLRQVRGAEENAIKAARASVHIDRLVDRGVAGEQPDERPVPNPERSALRDAHLEVKQRIAALESEQPRAGRSERAIAQEAFVADLEKAVLDAKLRITPTNVPRNLLDPDARTAWLQTKNRALLLPLKLAADNARRWLLGTLGRALAPTDHDYDATTMPRTMMALLQAPGTVRFHQREVVATIDLPLPPTAHARLDAALRALDELDLRFPDSTRSREIARALRFRLAPRATRAALPHRTRLREGGP